MKVDAKTFEEKTGRPPRQDELYRVNCHVAGKVGHFMCGWCNGCDKPRFECGHLVVGTDDG